VPIIESDDRYAEEATNCLIFQRFFVKALDRLARPRVEGMEE
jgi:hypothetical protein